MLNNIPHFFQIQARKDTHIHDRPSVCISYIQQLLRELLRVDRTQRHAPRDLGPVHFLKESNNIKSRLKTTYI